MGPQVLYRHFDSDGVLLYVGISGQLGARTKQHQRSARWFEQISHITVEHFPTRQQVVEAEMRAIYNERPVYNKVHNLSDKISPGERIAEMFGADVLDSDWVSYNQVAAELMLDGDALDIAVDWPKFPQPEERYTRNCRWKAGAIRKWVHVHGWDLLRIWDLCDELEEEARLEGQVEEEIEAAIAATFKARREAEKVVGVQC